MHFHAVLCCRGKAHPIIAFDADNRQLALTMAGSMAVQKVAILIVVMQPECDEYSCQIDEAGVTANSWMRCDVCTNWFPFY